MIILKGVTGGNNAFHPLLELASASFDENLEDASHMLAQLQTEFENVKIALEATPIR